jgi:hypothetical protein
MAEMGAEAVMALRGAMALRALPEVFLQRRSVSKLAMGETVRLALQEGAAGLPDRAAEVDVVAM